MQPSEAPHLLLTGRNHQVVVSSTELAVTEKEKPQPGLTPDWGFLVTLSLLPPRGKRRVLRRPVPLTKASG